MLKIALIFIELVSAQPRFKQQVGQVGQFDLYVFALTWSPAYCASKTPAPELPQQCLLGEGFVVHGLWPQLASGPNPQYCASAPAVKLEDVEPARVGPLRMPDSPSLWSHEWSKHGICSGLTSPQYFSAIGIAASRINVPPRFQQVTAEPSRERLENIEKLFVEANPGLTYDQIEVRTDRQGRISEVVICLDKELSFTQCKNVRQAPPGAGGILISPKGQSAVGF
jgi:ribonuclease T2